MIKKSESNAQSKFCFEICKIVALTVCRNVILKHEVAFTRALLLSLLKSENVCAERIVSVWVEGNVRGPMYTKF